MKNLLFGTLVVLSTILASCGGAEKAEEKTTEDSTKVEVAPVVTPAVDSAKVEK